MIIKRKEGTYPTLAVSNGKAKWIFPQEYLFFMIEDGDTFAVLTRGNFSLLHRHELVHLQETDVFVVQRIGPPVVGDCCVSTAARDEVRRYNTELSET